jgi:peptidoglycan hydrolase-like protein with peptidoglycan-binding domain
MKSRLLLSTAALLAGVAMASAQTMQRGAGEQGLSPGAQKSSPSAQGMSPGASGSAMPQRGNQMRPAQDAGRDSGRSTTGQAPAAGDTGSQRGQARDSAPSRAGADLGQRQQDRTTGQGAQRDGAQQGRQPDRQSDRMGQDDRRGVQPQQRQQRRQTEGQAGPRQDRQDRAGAAAQSDARGRVTLNTQQRTRIRETVLRGRNVPRVDRVNFSLGVGVAVPAHIHLVAVPPALVAIHPAWRGHMYFVVNDDIVIVDDRREIVSVVSVGSTQAGVGGPVESGGDAMAMELSEAEIREVQQVLISRGFLVGEADGIFGPRTRAALVTFQRREGLAVTGRIDTRTVTAMRLSDKITVREGIRTRQRSTVGQGRDSTQQRQGRDGQRSQGRNAKQPSQSRDAKQQSPDRQNRDARQPSRDRTTTGQGSGNQQPRANQRMPSGQSEKSGSEKSGSAPSTTGQSSGNQQPRANQSMPSGRSGTSGSAAPSTTGQASKPSAGMPRERDSGSPASSSGQAR